MRLVLVAIHGGSVVCVCDMVRHCNMVPRTLSQDGTYVNAVVRHSVIVRQHGYYLYNI